MSNKILCEVSDLTPIAEAVRNAENKTDLYSLRDLSLKASALLANGGSDEFLDELNAVNGTAASTMADAVDNTETLVGSQTDLIAQIAAALEGKAAGGGSGGTVETCTVIGNGFEGTCYYSNGTQVMEDSMSLYYGTPITVAKNSILACDYFSSSSDKISISGDAEIIQEDYTDFKVAVYGDCTIEIYGSNDGPM